MTVSGRNYYVYLLLSDKGTLYTGLVRDLQLAVHRHRTKESPGNHDPKRLVYHEMFTDGKSAKSRAKEIKGLSRKEKVELIHSANPMLADRIGRDRLGANTPIRPSLRDLD
jgi:putative endonuclease